MTTADTAQRAGVHRMAATAWRCLTLRWWGDSYEHQVGAALVSFAVIFATSVIAISVAAVWAAAHP